jgi:glutamyl-tRNA synthetase
MTIQEMPLDELIPLVKAELRANKLWREEYADDEHEWFMKTIDLLREHFSALQDFSNQGRAYFSDDFDLDEAAVSDLKQEPRLRELLNALADKLADLEPFNATTVESELREFAEHTGIKPELLINGSRTMLTGQAVGPSMFAVFEILGKESSVERLRSGIPWN